MSLESMEPQRGRRKWSDSLVYHRNAVKFYFNSYQTLFKRGKKELWNNRSPFHLQILLMRNLQRAFRTAAVPAFIWRGGRGQTIEGDFSKIQAAMLEFNAESRRAIMSENSERNMSLTMSSLNFQLKHFKVWIKYFTVASIRNHALNCCSVWLHTIFKRFYFQNSTHHMHY